MMGVPYEETFTADLYGSAVDIHEHLRGKTRRTPPCKTLEELDGESFDSPELVAYCTERKTREEVDDVKVRRVA